MQDYAGAAMVPEFDIVVVGAGPAGLMISNCLSRWGYTIKHIDKSARPTTVGRADGIQPRSLELFRNLGLKSALMAQHPSRIYEIATWKHTESGPGLQRFGTHPATPLGVRYPFVTILGQGRIEKILVEQLQNQHVQVDRLCSLVSFEVDQNQSAQHPVTVNVKHQVSAAPETVKAKYLIGADGARSLVREQLGINMSYEKSSAFNVWGVIDGEVTTDFPDIRVMCNLTGPKGNALLVPREHGRVRLYVHLATLPDQDASDQFTARERDVKERARAIFLPYHFQWDAVHWYSIYPIRQGIADRFTLDERVFLIGDACHVHSPKAGQGMNNAFLDGQNLAWKIHMVERQWAQRSILETYESERKSVARTLIAFDTYYAALFSQRSLNSDNHVSGPADDNLSQSTQETVDLSQEYQKACAFISGYGVTYPQNILNWSASHAIQSPVIRRDSTLQPGHLFVSSVVTRVEDWRPIPLEHAISMDGRFRLFLFAGKPSVTADALKDFAGRLRQDSLLSKHLGTEPSVAKTHAPDPGLFALCIIFATTKDEFSLQRDVPGPLHSFRGHVYLDEVHYMTGRSKKNAAHEKAGATIDEGTIMVVRPDGYVAMTLRLSQGPETVNTLSRYFSSLCS